MFLLLGRPGDQAPVRVRQTYAGREHLSSKVLHSKRKWLDSLRVVPVDYCGLIEQQKSAVSERLPAGDDSKHLPVSRTLGSTPSTLHPDRLGGGGLYAARAPVSRHDRELNRANGEIQGHPRGQSALERTDPSDPPTSQLKRHPGARRVVG